MLTDFDATKKAMEEAITGLISGGKRGDVLLVHFSGHGSNVPDDNDDEEDDNRDEILCPTDLDWYDPLRDDWLRNVFDGLKCRGEPHSDHRQLSFRHRHAGHRTARRADDRAIPSEPVGPGRRWSPGAV